MPRGRLPKPQRHYFPDEEPDTPDYIGWEWAADLCKFCGQGGHNDKACPTRPL